MNRAAASASLRRCIRELHRRGVAWSFSTGRWIAPGEPGHAEALLEASAPGARHGYAPDPEKTAAAWAELTNTNEPAAARAGGR